MCLCFLDGVFHRNIPALCSSFIIALKSSLFSIFTNRKFIESGNLWKLTKCSLWHSPSNLQTKLKIDVGGSLRPDRSAAPFEKRLPIVTQRSELVTSFYFCSLLNQALVLEYVSLLRCHVLENLQMASINYHLRLHAL